jgi:tetratricopeptide (TPR) repeat protein
MSLPKKIFILLVINHLFFSVSAKNLQPDSVAITHKVMMPPVASKPLKPNRLRQMNNAGVRFGNKGNYHNAKNLFLEAQAQIPNDTLAHNLALANGFLKRYDEALNLLPETHLGRRALQNKGAFHAQLGHIDEAVTIWKSTFPTDTLCFNMALVHYRQQDLKEATSWAQRFGFSKNGLFHELYGNVLYHAGRYKEAEKFYEKSEKVNPNMRLLVQRGNAHLVQHEYEKAEALFDQYLSSKHANYRFEARLGLGHAFYRQRKYTEAALEYDAACRLGDASVEAWASLGHAYLNTNSNRQAQKAYERAIGLDHVHKPAWLGLAVVYYRIKNYGEALCCFDQAQGLMTAKNRDHADLYAIRGFCRLYLNDTKASKADIDTSVRLSPKGLLPCIAMSEFLRIEQYFLSSLKWLERAIKANEAASVKMLVNRGNIYLKCREFEDAYNDFAEAHRLDGGNTNATNGLAISLLNMNEMDKAKVLYDSLLRKKNYAMLHNNRGIVEAYMALRSRQQHNPNDQLKHELLSLKNFEKGLDIDSTKQAYHVNIGNIFKGQDKNIEAIDQYQKHLSKNAINNLGLLFTKGEKPDYARHYLNTVVNLDTANQIYLYNRAKIVRDFYKSEFLRNSEYQRAFKLAPTNDIAIRYSPDGFITIYLFDYDFEKFEFPGEPLMAIAPRAIDDFAYLISPDFVSMHGDGAALKNSLSESYEVSARPKKFREAPSRRRGSTKCPTF